MTHLRWAILVLPAVTAATSGCDLVSPARYYTSTAESSDVTTTTVHDADTGAPVIEIIELDEGPPAIRVLPPPSGVPSAAPSIWSDSVRIERSSNGDAQVYGINFESTGMTMPAGIANQDTDQDGRTDTRFITLPAGAGFLIYHDFDADGVLDAYQQLEVEGETKTSRRAILVQDRWVAVAPTDTMFKQRPRVATRLDSPTTAYEFRHGQWEAANSENAEE